MNGTILRILRASRRLGAVAVLAAVLLALGAGVALAVTTVDTSGNDTLVGTSVQDSLYGHAGNDVLYGRAGNDYLYGETGDNKLYGEAGDDRLYGGTGTNEYIDSGTGNDIIYSRAYKNLVYGLDGNDQMIGGTGIEGLYGGSGNDLLSGYFGPDVLVGNADADRLIWRWRKRFHLLGGGWRSVRYHRLRQRNRRACG